jgi:hypothetical protein
MTGVLDAACHLKLYKTHDVSVDIYLIRQLERGRDTLIMWAVVERPTLNRWTPTFPLSTVHLNKDTDTVS